MATTATTTEAAPASRYEVRDGNDTPCPSTYYGQPACKRNDCRACKRRRAWRLTGHFYHELRTHLDGGRYRLHFATLTLHPSFEPEGWEGQHRAMQAAFESVRRSRRLAGVKHVRALGVTRAGTLHAHAVYLAPPDVDLAAVLPEVWGLGRVHVEPVTTAADLFGRVRYTMNNIVPVDLPGVRLVESSRGLGYNTTKAKAARRSWHADREAERGAALAALLDAAGISLPGPERSPVAAWGWGTSGNPVGGGGPAGRAPLRRLTSLPPRRFVRSPASAPPRPPLPPPAVVRLPSPRPPGRRPGMEARRADRA